MIVLDELNFSGVFPDQYSSQKYHIHDQLFLADGRILYGKFFGERIIETKNQINETIIIERTNVIGDLHCTFAPAYVVVHDGQVVYEAWYHEGEKV